MKQSSLITFVRREHQNAVNELAAALEIIPKEKSVKFLCIGTDRLTGDSLGPLVGSFLKEKGFDVLGTLDKPVHAQNLRETINSLSGDDFILAIDACLGHRESIGNIVFKKGPIRPGTGVNIKLPEIGDYNIFAIVNVAGHREYEVLSCTSLCEVMKCAKIISRAIELAFAS